MTNKERVEKWAEEFLYYTVYGEKPYYGNETYFKEHTHHLSLKEMVNRFGKHLSHRQRQELKSYNTKK